jgi:hypothetical protein
MPRTPAAACLPRTALQQGRRDHNQIECLLADEKPGVDTPCGQDVEKKSADERGDRETRSFFL